MMCERLACKCDEKRFVLSFLRRQTSLQGNLSGGDGLRRTSDRVPSGMSDVPGIIMICHKKQSHIKQITREMASIAAAR
ncbi:hypothetical protein HZB03_02610 [Candidatus Woesearchaeota archaeon]|nr:hypothetical protein [Candidatus Woesearchaeota archaeon]